MDAGNKSGMQMTLGVLVWAMEYLDSGVLINIGNSGGEIYLGGRG